MIENVVLVSHLLVAGLIIALVLLQRGKGAEAGTGFGAGASGTVFGSRGSSNFFSRATAVLATLFFATSLALAYFATQATGVPGSLVDETLPEQSAPAVRAPPDGDVPTGNFLETPPAEAASESAPDTANGAGADQ
jgi:preprotein translocase subunit SecG